MNKIKKALCAITAVIGLVTGGVAIDSTLATGNVVIAGQSMGELKMSPVGLALVGNAEGCRLDPYKCPAGEATNGIGNTHGVPNRPISLEQVAKDWVRNIQSAEQCLDRVAPPDKAMTQGQHDAFTSFIFNTGCTRFTTNRNGTQTKIASLIKQGKYQQACGQLKRWVYAGGEKLRGLEIRRGDEYDRCMALD
ncbi:TPA: lysozyme [Photobacterium damselae]